MAKLVAFLRHRILWAGFLVVIVPLLIILGLQYKSLVKLETASAIARKVTLKNYLEAVATEVHYFYRTNAERALNIPSHYHDNLKLQFGGCNRPGIFIRRGGDCPEADEKRKEPVGSGGLLLIWAAPLCVQTRDLTRHHPYFARGRQPNAGD